MITPVLLRQQFPDVGRLEHTLTVAAKSCNTARWCYSYHAYVVDMYKIECRQDNCVLVWQQISFYTTHSSWSHYWYHPFWKDTVIIKSIVMQEQQGCDACGVFLLAVASAGEDTNTKIEWSSAMTAINGSMSLAWTYQQRSHSKGSSPVAFRRDMGVQ